MKKFMSILIVLTMVAALLPLISVSAAAEDTKALKLDAAIVKDANSVILRFSEPVQAPGEDNVCYLTDKSGDNPNGSYDKISYQLDTTVQFTALYAMHWEVTNAAWANAGNPSWATSQLEALKAYAVANYGFCSRRHC